MRLAQVNVPNVATVAKTVDETRAILVLSVRQAIRAVHALGERGYGRAWLRY